MEKMKGAIYHENEKIAKLDEVSLESKIEELPAFLGEGDSFENMPKKEIFFGKIIKGRFRSCIFDQKHYGSRGVSGSNNKYLRGNEYMVLETEDGKKLRLENLEFDVLPNTNETMEISDVDFTTRLIVPG